MESLKSLAGGWTVAARRCDSCKTAAAAAFCRAHSAFLCLNCDAKIHAANNKLVSRHERVWMCEVCEQAPAAVTCKADAAALCITCDADIHSANPLARRHERVPVEPFFDSADSIVKSSPFNFLVPTDHHHNGVAGSTAYGHQQHDQDDDVEGVSWLLPNPSKLGMENHHEMKLGHGGDTAADLFFTEMDPFLDLEFHQSSHTTSAANDSVVPVQITKPATATSINPVMNSDTCYGINIDFCRSKLSSFNYPAQSLSQSVSSSSLDVGVVPDGNSMSDISYPFGRNINTSTDSTMPISCNSTNQAAQMCGLDREARVLRYREKRKNRKFEKTIRYASRKAYAETRPRIKGRFAKRTEIDTDMDRLYNSPSSVSYLSDAQYGVVPTF